jgi:TonB family protein
MRGEPSSATGAFGAPRLEVHWQPRSTNFFESVGAAFRGPRATNLPAAGASFFRLRLSPRRFPFGGIAGSFAWHVILLSISIPVSQMVEPPAQLPLPQIDITWYGPAANVAPLVAPAESKPKTPTPPRPHPDHPVVARAYNPHTTVIFQPPRPTNARQILVQPDAPPTPPKSLPSLPNVIAWTAEAPKPAIPVNPSALVAKRAQPFTSAANSQAPLVGAPTPPPGPLNLAPDPQATPKPPVPIAPSAIRAERPLQPQNAPAAAPAPVVPATGDRLVALSLAPGTSMPPPPGNASAPISVGPVVGKSNSASASAVADVGSSAEIPGLAAPAGAVPGPAGLTILHEGPGPAAPPPPPAHALRLHIPAVNMLPALRPRVEPGMLAENRTGASRGGIIPHDLAHEVLGARPIHELLINMPDLTSATGSWVLDFAALPDEEVPLDGAVVAPLPVVKVDPKYPPALIEQKVEGEVVLYAVIGRDGNVNNIRVVKSLDPQLDQNAVDAFSQWRFRPGLVDNRQVGLEVIVHIPFRFASPQ